MVASNFLHLNDNGHIYFLLSIDARARLFLTFLAISFSLTATSTSEPNKSLLGHIRTSSLVSIYGIGYGFPDTLSGCAPVVAPPYHPCALPVVLRHRSYPQIDTPTEYHTRRARIANESNARSHYLLRPLYVRLFGSRRGRSFTLQEESNTRHCQA